MHILFILFEETNPLIMVICMIILLKEICKNMLYITNKRDCRSNVFAYFSRVNIYVYHNLILSNKIRPVYCTVRNSCSNHQKKIRLIHGSISIRGPVISDHSKIKRMLCRHNSNTHHGRYNRNIIKFSKLNDLAGSST